MNDLQKRNDTYIISNYILKNIWSQLRNDMTASSDFSETLRAKLYESSTKKEALFFTEYTKKIEIPAPNLILSIEKSESFIFTIKDFLKKFHENFIRFGFMIGGGAIALVLMVPLFSFFTSHTSSASEPSFIRDITGNIAIERSGVIFFPEENQELFNSDIIITNENSSLEIVFFEGTILRMAENSQIEIEKINPHPFLFSSGGITAHLEKGKVWVKTFQMASNGAGITLTTPNTIIYPEKSSFAAVYLDGKESILMMENTAIISLNGLIVEDNIEIHEGEMIQFTPFDTFTPLNEVIPKEWNIGWIAENIRKDKEYTNEYLERISQKMKEEYVLEELSLQIESFLSSNPDPDEVERLISEINNVMLASNTEEIVILKDEIIESPLVSPSPLAQAIPHKNNTQKQSYNYSQRTSRAITGSVVEKIEIVVENHEKNIETNEKEAKNDNPELLEDIQTKKTASEIAQEYRKKEKQEKIERAAESFSDQINAFEFENSRTTKAQNILDSIPEHAENLELLQKIEISAPEDVKEIVKTKLESIEKKVKEKEIKEYKENLKHSAPLQSFQIKTEILVENISLKNNIKTLETTLPSL